jgi:glutamate racemase
MSDSSRMRSQRPFSKTGAFLALVLVIFLPLSLDATETPATPSLQSFFQKGSVTIAATDSGLGGLAVMAEAARRMKETGVFKKVDFVFFNALFSLAGGYNSLKTREEKILVFNSALESLEKNFHPDLILIGCNTLSILYKETVFSQRTKIPVVGIVEAGVELISRSLREKPGSAVIIFATPTTISEETHKKRLLEQGFAASRIIVQSCPELENYIEKDHAGDETEMLISACVDEALQKTAVPRPPLFVSLNCTHFGYSLPLWEKAFHEAGVKPLGLLNPNSRMINFLFRPDHLKRYERTEISARVVSMVEISREKIQSLGTWLQAVSPETAAALSHYEYNASLFEWKKEVRAAQNIKARSSPGASLNSYFFCPL